LDFLTYRYGQNYTIEIYNIVVGSNRGKGIGTSMLKDLIKIAKLEMLSKRIYAYTRQENEMASKFYRKNNFNGTLIKNFYPDGNAIIYVKEI